MLSFDRLHQRILLKCTPLVQQDYFLHSIRALFSGVVLAVAVVFA